MYVLCRLNNVFRCFGVCYKSTQVNGNKFYFDAQNTQYHRYSFDLYLIAIGLLRRLDCSRLQRCSSLKHSQQLSKATLHNYVNWFQSKYFNDHQVTSSMKTSSLCTVISSGGGLDQSCSSTSPHSRKAAAPKRLMAAEM